MQIFHLLGGGVNQHLENYICSCIYFLKASNYIGSTVENRSLLEFAKL